MKSLLKYSKILFILVGILFCFHVYENKESSRNDENVCLQKATSSSDVFQLDAVHFYSTDFVQPTQISVPSIERNNTSRVHFSYRFFCRFIVKQSVFVKLHHCSYLQMAFRSHLKVIGYYIYQLCKIII